MSEQRMTKKKLYAERDIIEQMQHYVDHVEAMTAEGLHSKSDIAAELAHRDIEIERLERELTAALDRERKLLAIPIALKEAGFVVSDRAAAEPSVCPWCGSRCQHTDPRGTCARCKISWKRSDWVPGIDDKRHEALQAMFRGLSSSPPPDADRVQLLEARILDLCRAMMDGDSADWFDSAQKAIATVGKDRYNALALATPNPYSASTKAAEHHMFCKSMYSDPATGGKLPCDCAATAQGESPSHE
jgi:predicted Zn-ribbon and HTH transcriptional regulator